jgi:L,D-transpeptidase catalytic domain
MNRSLYGGHVNFPGWDESRKLYPPLELTVLECSRRFFLKFSLAGVAAASASARSALWQTEGLRAQIAPSVLRRALDALQRHQDRITCRDAIGVADFSHPSRVPRFHLVKLADGSVQSHLVAHGRGSDPRRTGWLERFSNEPRSNATSAGAYQTACFYVGAHGHAIRLEGLDPTNSNASSRAIVVHGAWYLSKEMIGLSGMLGRSQGCFAVANSSLPDIMMRLGPGRLIYAGNDKALA